MHKISEEFQFRPNRTTDTELAPLQLLKDKHFPWSFMLGFPKILIILCFANNYISVLVQAENVLDAGLHLFQILDVEFPL